MQGTILSQDAGPTKYARKIAWEKFVLRVAHVRNAKVSTYCPLLLIYSEHHHNFLMAALLPSEMVLFR